MEKQKAFEIPETTSGGIYMLYNVSGCKAYIGETRNFQQRARMHKYSLESHSHASKKIQEDFDKGDEFAFVLLEDMGRDCSVEELVIREKQYMLAFHNKYLELYNHESAEQIKDLLFQTLVAPLVYSVQSRLQRTLHCPLPTLERCNAETLKSKFECVNNEIIGKKKDG
jgi:hypothetical protein